MGYVLGLKTLIDLGCAIQAWRNPPLALMFVGFVVVDISSLWLAGRA